MVFIAGSTEAAAEVWTQAAHRPAVRYPHAGQIVMRLSSAPALVDIGVPFAVAESCTRCEGLSRICADPRDAAA